MKLKEAEEYLEHYGKRGMKWGIRNKVEKAIPKEGGGFKAEVARKQDFTKEQRAVIEGIAKGMRRQFDQETRIEGGVYARQWLERYGGIKIENLTVPSIADIDRAAAYRKEVLG